MPFFDDVAEPSDLAPRDLVTEALDLVARKVFDLTESEGKAALKRLMTETDDDGKTLRYGAPPGSTWQTFRKTCAATSRMRPASSAARAPTAPPGSSTTASKSRSATT